MQCDAGVCVMYAGVCVMYAFARGECMRVYAGHMRRDAGVCRRMQLTFNPHLLVVFWRHLAIIFTKHWLHVLVVVVGREDGCFSLACSVLRHDLEAP